MLGGFLVAGADEGEALVGVDVGVKCYDRLVGACDSGCNCFGLKRSDQVAVIVGNEVGLDGVELLLVVGLSRRAVDGQLDFFRVLLLVGFRTGLNDVPELGGVGLERHADLVGLVRSVVRTACRGVAAAARCEAHCHRCCHQSRHKSFLHHSELSFSLYTLL